MTKEHKIFLDMLRESGAANMFGAVLYLIEEFPELTGQEAKEIVSEWMRTFQ